MFIEPSFLADDNTDDFPCFNRGGGYGDGNAAGRGDGDREEISYWYINGQDYNDGIGFENYDNE